MTSVRPITAKSVHRFIDVSGLDPVRTSVPRAGPGMAKVTNPSMNNVPCNLHRRNHTGVSDDLAGRVERRTVLSAPAAALGGPLCQL